MTFHPENFLILPIGLVVGILATGIGIWFWRKTRRFLATAKETTGEIVGSSRSGTIEGKGTSYAVVRFVTDAGEEVEYESMAGFPWAGKNPGKQVPVLYNPENPQEARINSFVELTLPWLIFLLTGLLISCCTVSLLVYSLFQGS